MPRRKALKVIVDIHFHAITCPGVFLPEQEDVFLNIELLGQIKKTRSAPPVFPFLFHEKLRFDKVFSHATDPVQIATALNSEVFRVELIQLNCTGGELLATYEDNARDFLFPTPRASPTYPGVDREILLQRSYSFPGIAPKLEFSSRTIIKEVTSIGGSSHNSFSKSKRDSRNRSDVVDQYKLSANSYNNFDTRPIESSTPLVQGRKSPKKKNTNLGGSRPGRSKGRSASLSRATSGKGYEQSTVASRARSPSPYTKRRMAQLSVQDPFESAIKEKPFKTNVEERPAFAIRKAEEDTMVKPAPPLPRLSPSPQRSRRTPSPRNSCSKRKQTPGRQLRSKSQTRNYYSDEEWDSDFFVEGCADCEPIISRVQRENEKYNQQKRNAFKSAYYRPITSASLVYGHPADKLNDELASFLKNKDWKDDIAFERLLNSPIERRRTTSPCCSTVSAPAKIRGRERGRKKKKAASVRFKNTTDLIDSETPRRSPGSSRPNSARSYPDSTPRRDLSFSSKHEDFDLPGDTRTSKVTTDSILYRTPFRERYGNDVQSPYEKIRDRVRDLLVSPRATRILDESVAEAKERYWLRKSRTPSPKSSPRNDVTVRLGDGEFWNNKLVEFTGKSHRKIFEESLDKIYDDIYTNVRTGKP